MGIAIHSDRIMIGIVMVLISTLGVINGLRDVVQRNFTSGTLEIMNSVLGALGIAFGIALAMKMLHGGGNAGGAVLNSNIFVQAVSVSVGSIGLAGIYQIRGKKCYLFRDRSISDMDSLSDRETIRRQLFVRNASGICICGNVCICNGQN